MDAILRHQPMPLGKQQHDCFVLKASELLQGAECKRLMRFAAVGFLAAAIYVGGTSALRRYAQVPLPVAASASFVVVAALNYVLHYAWTFQSRRSHTKAMPRFIVTTSGAMALNVATLTVVPRWFSVTQAYALLLGIALILVWNYLLSRFWVFLDRGTDR